jgi:hypothetical protein
VHERCEGAVHHHFDIGGGDPINANCPGTYLDAKINHPAPLDGSMAPTQITINGQNHMVAKPWEQLGPTGVNVLDRTVFWHLMTNTPIHPKEPDVLKLMETTAYNEMLPSLLAKQLAPCLGTIQAQPISVGASTPAEGLVYGGQAQPIIPPLALKATLTNPVSPDPRAPLTDLQQLRDDSLNQLYDLYKNNANTAQRAYIDSMVTTQTQVRSINQNLLAMLNTIKDNSVAAQITAALALIQMKVSPVIAIHIPFGGDNHQDTNLMAETAQTLSGTASIASLMQQLQTTKMNNVPLSELVTFMTLNVFGRTLTPVGSGGNGYDGRNHNQFHQVSLTIGKPFQGGVIGGVGPVMGFNDYGAQQFDSKTGKVSLMGDVSPLRSLASFGQSMLAAVGVDQATISSLIMSGTVIKAALKP